MGFTFKTHAELEHNTRIMEATPRRFIVLEEPIIFNYLKLKNELYTENVKRVLRYDEDNKPIVWQTNDGTITYIEKTSEAEIIITHATHTQYLHEQETINAKLLKDDLLNKRLLKEQNEAFKQIMEKTNY